MRSPVVVGPEDRVDRRRSSWPVGVLLSWPEAAWLRLMGLPGRGAGRSEAGTRIQVAEGVGAAAGGVFLVATVHSACAVASLIPARRRRLLSCGRPTRRRAAAPGQGPLQFDLQ
jgi:hypothetical protein